MAVNRDVLGMNARNFLYISRYNPRSSIKIADNKLESKRLFLRNGIVTPDLYCIIQNGDDFSKVNWEAFLNGFVIKPARGYGGAGILVFKSWTKAGGQTISDEQYQLSSLKSHTLDILDGVYSLQYLPDKAFIEQRIVPHSFFKKLYPKGLTDIRVIVFNSIPVMAMLRIPTDQSKGKANWTLGAIAVGIDLRTGITTYAYTKSGPVQLLPSVKIKPKGLKIPLWDEILLLASRVQKISGLGFLGVDVVIDVKKGPLVLEINARPGLSIQKANHASLRERLERVEGMDMPTPERGVEVGRSLFAEANFGTIHTGPKILSVIEPVKIYINGKTRLIKAKVDTGAYRSSLDLSLALELGLTQLPNSIEIKAASGRQVRQTVEISFDLSGKKIKTVATITPRDHLRYQMIVGRKDLKGFLVDPHLAKKDFFQDEET